jgi:hypothetical protein
MIDIKETPVDSELEFDSEFCNVRYIANDNVVLLSWKKFARIDDYRRPTLFALSLLEKYPHSNFVVDARNSFEDDKDDVEWGFSILLPAMAKTDCRYVAFIMLRVTNVEEEMDMWTKQFGKYFAVVKTESYEQTIKKINNRIMVNVNYEIKSGKRDEFLKKVDELEIARDSKA